MNVTSMSKEHKQYAVLGILIVGIALFSVFTFGVGPMKRNWAEASKQTNELLTKVDEGERMIRNRDKVTENLAASDEVMRAASSEYIPDTSNPLAWATRNLYAAGREVGLDIRSVSEQSASPILTKHSGDGHRAFSSYSVRVDAACGFALLKDFLHALEGANPYVCVSGISVDTDSSQPEQHKMNLTIEWPAWTEDAGANEPIGLKGV